MPGGDAEQAKKRIALYYANLAQMDECLGKVLAALRELDLEKKLREFQPRIEIYLQEMKPDAELGAVPLNDRYWLGKIDMRMHSFAKSGLNFLECDHRGSDQARSGERQFRRFTCLQKCRQRNCAVSLG